MGLVGLGPTIRKSSLPYNINTYSSLFQVAIYRGGGRYLRLGGGTDDGACVSTNALGRSGDMLLQKIRCSEIASEAIFVFKFIFGLDAAGILGPCVFWSAARHVQGSLSHHCTCSSGVWSKRSLYRTVLKGGGALKGKSLPRKSPLPHPPPDHSSNPSYTTVQ